MYKVVTNLEALLERLPPGIAVLVSDAAKRSKVN